MVSQATKGILMFSSTSYFWPLLIGLVLFGVVSIGAIVVFGFVFARRSESTTPVATPTAEPHLAAKRLNAVLTAADLHEHDKTVLDTVAAKLEPGPITREGQEAQLRAMIDATKEKSE